MNLANFMVAVGGRTGNLPRPESIDHAVSTLVGLGVLPGPQGRAVRCVLGCLIAAETSAADISFRELAVLSPVALASLEMVIEGLLQGIYTPGELREAVGLS